jgi:hypothetical protein
MKSIIAISAGATLLLASVVPVMAGAAGVERPAYQTPYQQQEVLSELEEASGPARVAAEENKNHPPYINRAYEIDQLIRKVKAGEPVSQEEVDQALTPITTY